MKRQDLRNLEGVQPRRGNGTLKAIAILGLCWGGLGMATSTEAKAGAVSSAQDQVGAGMTFSKQATSKEVGLPVYPGARMRKEEKEDSPSVQMGIWGSTFGFKLAVMKMESNDAPEKVAEYYKKALGKYGTVLNCSDPSRSSSAKEKSESSNKIECDDDKPEKGGLVFKAGTKEKQHVVAIQPNGPGSLFQLVYVEARSDDKEKRAN